MPDDGVLRAEEITVQLTREQITQTISAVENDEGYHESWVKPITERLWAALRSDPTPSESEGAKAPDTDIEGIEPDPERPSEGGDGLDFDHDGIEPESEPPTGGKVEAGGIRLDGITNRTNPDPWPPTG